MPMPTLWCTRGGQPQWGLWLADCHGENRHHLVEAPSDAPYVALSYVWNSSKAASAYDLDTSGDGTPKLPPSLPLVVEDAIQVVKALGFRYLWVDKFCINQKDEAIKGMQIQHMDAVYENADITIIAAAGTLAYQVSAGRRGRHSQSPLSTTTSA